MSNATRTWRAWPKLAFPYAENGLGVRSFRDLLKAYSCKLWWKLRTMEGLWSKYVNSVGLNKSFVAGRVARVHDLMQAHPRILVGNGECSFWHANWSGQGCLSDIFPDVDPVSGNLNLYLHEGFWSLDMLPHVVVPFVLEFHIHFTGLVDRLIWEPERSGLFTLASAYQLVRQKREVQPVLKAVWGSRIPTKISFFFWRLLNNLLPFDDVLRGLGISLASKCVFCSSEDTLQHGFLACSFAERFWAWIDLNFGVQIVLSSFSQFFESFSTSNLVQPQDLLNSLPVFGCWLIWVFRCRAFHDGFNSAGQELIHQFRELLSLCSLRKPFHVPRHLPNHLTFSPSRRFSHSFLRLQWSPPPTCLLQIEY